MELHLTESGNSSARDMKSILVRIEKFNPTTHVRALGASIHDKIADNLRHGGDPAGSWAPNKKTTILQKGHDRPLYGPTSQDTILGQVRVHTMSGGAGSGSATLTVLARPKAYAAHVGSPATKLVAAPGKNFLFRVPERFTTKGTDAYYKRRATQRKAYLAGTRKAPVGGEKNIWVRAHEVTIPAIPARPLFNLSRQFVRDNYFRPVFDWLTQRATSARATTPKSPRITNAADDEQSYWDSQGF